MQGSGRGTGENNERINAKLGPFAATTRYMNGRNREATLEYVLHRATMALQRRQAVQLVAMISRTVLELRVIEVEELKQRALLRELLLALPEARGPAASDETVDQVSKPDCDTFNRSLPFYPSARTPPVYSSYFFHPSHPL